MVKVYFDLINYGLRKVEDVPPLWKDGVIAMLEKEKNK